MGTTNNMDAEREQLISASGQYAGRYGAAPSVESTLRKQDGDLDDLSVGVRGVRDVAFAINKEVNSQLSMLDNLGARMDHTSESVSTQTVRAATNTESVYTIKNFCMLLCPLVLLIVLVIESVLHFIF